MLFAMQTENTSKNSLLWFSFSHFSTSCVNAPLEVIVLSASFVFHCLTYVFFRHSQNIKKKTEASPNKFALTMKDKVRCFPQYFVPDVEYGVRNHVFDFVLLVVREMEQGSVESFLPYPRVLDSFGCDHEVPGKIER